MPPASGAPNPRGERRNVPRRPSGTMWYGLAFLFLLVLAQTYFLVPAGRQIPYSEFKSLVAQGKVAEATVGEQDHSRHAEVRRRERETRAVRHDAHRGPVARRRARKEPASNTAAS